MARVMRVVFGFKQPIHHLVKLVLGYFTPCETLPDCGEGTGRHPCMVAGFGRLQWASARTVRTATAAPTAHPSPIPPSGVIVGTI